MSLQSTIQLILAYLNERQLTVGDEAAVPVTWPPEINYRLRKSLMSRYQVRSKIKGSRTKRVLAFDVVPAMLAGAA